MTDESVYTDYFKSVKSCSKAAQRDFAKVWNLLDLNDVETSKMYLLELLPGLVEKYGDGAAEAAARMYEAVLLAEKGETVTAELSKVNRDKVVRTVYQVVRFMEQGEYQRAFSTMNTVVDHQVKQTARRTVETNAKRDGVRYARVPTGRETCGFCIMLASRGFVYHSEHTAGGLNHDYHPHCDCMPVPSTQADVTVPGYDQSYYKGIYDDARKKVVDTAEWKSYGQQHAYEEQSKMLANQIRLDVYPKQKDHINEVKRQWWAANKDEQNAKRRAKAAAKRNSTK